MRDLAQTSDRDSQPKRWAKSPNLGFWACGPVETNLRAGPVGPSEGGAMAVVDVLRGGLGGLLVLRQLQQQTAQRLVRAAHAPRVFGRGTLYSERMHGWRTRAAECVPQEKSWKVTFTGLTQNSQDNPAVSLQTPIRALETNFSYS